MAESNHDQGQTWQPEDYARHAAFVPELGLPVVELLAPKPGERILDLGCGDGALTARLMALGCEVIGVDQSPEMVASARARGIDARVMAGEDLGFAGEFDAVFSNAALHWMKRNPDAVIAGVARALRPGGRFVGEMGGHGNVAAICVALQAVREMHGVEPRDASPWYFPTPSAYRERLERAGFHVATIELLPRPTLLPTGMAGWLETFAAPFTRMLPEPARASFLEHVTGLLAPQLCDDKGHWTADYVRLRFAARLEGHAFR